MSDVKNAAVIEAYSMSVTLLERLHRNLLDMIAFELDRAGMHGVNSTQAMLLYNVGDFEVNAGELRTHGHYLGSNVSYNLKKLAQAGYMRAVRSPSDLRVVRVQLTERGQQVRHLIAALFARQAASLQQTAQLGGEELRIINSGLAEISKLWRGHVSRDS